MRRLTLGTTDPRQYEGLTPAEIEAWNHPQRDTYHSFHVERMAEHVWRWRDSREAAFYVGTLAELADALIVMKLRQLDPDYRQHVTTLNILSQEEVDDLLKDL